MNHPEIDRTLLKSVLYLADRGFHGSTIGRITGLTTGQVYYRTKRLGLQLRHYRDGSSKTAKQYIAYTPCVTSNIKAKKGEVYKVAGVEVHDGVAA